MHTLISILIIITCILLILIVLVQNSKGGGLASNFSASNQVMGVRRTNDFLEKSTWTLAIVLLALCLVSSMTVPRDEQAEAQSSAIQDKVDNAQTPEQQPVAPPPAAEETPAK